MNERCQHPRKTPDEHYKGKCSDCQRIDRTCTVCGDELSEMIHVFIKVRDGKEIARGHRECVETINI